VNAVPYDYVFTVFTATYNRAHTLHRVYDSLAAQTFRDFEWLVVDDGSTDSTRALLSSWRKGAAFNIRYLHQPNQGKHVAYNHAVAKARGALFLTLDSDDACVPHALETLKYHWDAIPSELKHRFSGISALCVDQRDRVIGDSFPRHPFDSDYFACLYRWKLSGDKCGFYRTDILREFPFPVPPVRLSHIPEGVVWSRIGKKYQTRHINESLYRVYETEGSLTRIRDLSQHAFQIVFYRRVVLNEHLDYFCYAPLDFVRAGANYLRWSLHLSESVLRQIGLLRRVGARIMCVLLLPVATVLFLDDRRSNAIGRRWRLVEAAIGILRVRRHR